AVMAVSVTTLQRSKLALTEQVPPIAEVPGELSLGASLLTVAVIVIGTSRPWFRAPTLHVTTPPLAVHDWVVALKNEAESNVTCGSSVSVTTTPFAIVVVEVLVTLTVYVNVPPGDTGSGSSRFCTETSAVTVL